MGHAKEPHRGHHELLNRLRETCGSYALQGIGDVEQIAILAQLIGGKIHDLDERQYDISEIMQAVSRNIVAGNAAVGGANLIGLGRSS